MQIYEVGVILAPLYFETGSHYANGYMFKYALGRKYFVLSQCVII
jgi:hypothetical protein